MTYIVKNRAGLQNVQIQPEMKSSAQTAGTKVVVVDNTVLLLNPHQIFTYLSIGEVEFPCMLNGVKEFSSAPPTLTFDTYHFVLACSLPS